MIFIRFFVCNFIDDIEWLWLCLGHFTKIAIANWGIKFGHVVQVLLLNKINFKILDFLFLFFYDLIKPVSLKKLSIQWLPKPSTLLKRFHSNNHTISINEQSPKVDIRILSVANFFLELWKKYLCLGMLVYIISDCCTQKVKEIIIYWI